jgi:hypothetical protein
MQPEVRRLSSVVFTSAELTGEQCLWFSYEARVISHLSPSHCLALLRFFFFFFFFGGGGSLGGVCLFVCLFLL